MYQHDDIFCWHKTSWTFQQLHTEGRKEWEDIYAFYGYKILYTWAQDKTSGASLQALIMKAWKFAIAI